MLWLRLLSLGIGIALMAAASLIPNFHRGLLVSLLGLAIGFCFAYVFASLPVQRVRDVWSNVVTRWRYPKSSLLASCLTLFLALLPALEQGHFPYPSIHDEFSYALAADTFAHGRLANPTPAGWEHFESFHIIVTPSYQSKYQPGMGLMLAVGQVLFGHIYFGVLLSLVLATLALDWMFHVWLPVRWALPATLLACFPLCGNWGNGYFVGGPMAVIGGAMLLASYRLIIRRGVRWQDGFILATSLVLFFWTRPFEGAVVSVCVGVPLFVHIVRYGGMRRLLWPLIPTSLLVLAPAGYFQMQLNQACTGSAVTLPYVEHDRQYLLAPSFLLQTPRSDIPSYHHREIETFNHDMLQWHQWQRSGENWITVEGCKFGVAWMMFFPLLWFFPLGALPELLSHRWARFALMVWAIILMAIHTCTWFLHHYAAPGFAAWTYVVVMSLLYTLRWRVRGYSLGRFLVIMAVAASIVCILFELVLAGIDAHHQWTESRAKIVRQLRDLGGSHLVLLEYDPKHPIGQEWVYNGANIPSQAIIWARSMDALKNKKLIEYYPGRKVWLLKLIGKDAEGKWELSPYDAASSSP